MPVWREGLGDPKNKQKQNKKKEAKNKCHAKAFANKKGWWRPCSWDCLASDNKWLLQFNSTFRSWSSFFFGTLCQTLIRISWTIIRPQTTKCSIAVNLRGCLPHFSPSVFMFCYCALSICLLWNLVDFRFLLPHNWPVEGDSTGQLCVMCTVLLWTLTDFYFTIIIIIIF